MPCRVFRLILPIVICLAVGCAQAADTQPAMAGSAGAGRPGAAHATAGKVLRVAIGSAETGFDPARAIDLSSSIIIGAIFEQLLTYDRLARPVKLVPMAAREMPQVSDDGLRYTFRLRPGVLFAPDPAFGTAPRELVAADFVYALLRVMDPANQSPWKNQLEGRVVGLDQAAARAGGVDYDAPVAGLRATDRHTLQITLTRPDPTFLHLMAEPAMSAVAREVITAHAGEPGAHPVGTNAYRLERWVRGSRMVLTANPVYRGFDWQFEPGPDARDQAIVAQMRGRRMPAIGRVEISVIEEPQAMWLAFQGGQLDHVNLPAEFSERALDAGNRLLPELAGRGIGLDRTLDPDINYTFLNTRDPDIGGFSPARIALRRAIIMAYDIDEDIRVLRRGQAVRAQFIAPPAVVGHDAEYRSSQRFDPPLANALLDRHGYRRGADGWRRTPQGKPLVFTLFSTPQSVDRQRDELWKRSLQRVGIRLAVRKDRFGELLKQAKQCRVSAWGLAWIADIPDASNFFQTLAGGNIGRANNGCFDLPAFDELFQRSELLGDGPQRRQLYRQMQRLLEVNGGWVIGYTRYRNQLVAPQVLGYRHHPIVHADFMYLDIDPALAR